MERAQANEAGPDLTGLPTLDGWEQLVEGKAHPQRRQFQ